MSVRHKLRPGIALAAASWSMLVIAGLQTTPATVGQEIGDGRPAMPRFHRFGSSSEAGWNQETGPVNRGFVFVEGEYLSPPYEFESDEESVLINGHALKHRVPEYGPGGGRVFLHGGGPGGGGSGAPGWNGGGPGWRGGSGGFGVPGESMRSESGTRRQTAELYSQLASGGVIISFAEQPLVLLDNGGTYDLLSAMTGKLNAVRPVSLAEQLPSDFDRDLWREWQMQFKPSDELRSRATSLIATHDTAEREALAAIAARRRLNTLAYPLTVGGMVLTVLAIGHLLGGRPHAGKPSLGIDASPEMIRALNWSLALVAVLTVLDLAWTILAAQAGEMHELNPVGSHLIENPRHLIGFKIGIMLPVIGLLWLLRRYKRAQIAGWWACLLLTILAFRWLTFNSMFVSGGTI